MKKLQKNLLLVTLFLVVIVIAKGAFTRLVDAGLGCPDWPGCYGFIHIPTSDEHIELANLAYPEQPYEFSKAWPEMVHRYLASILGLLIIGLFVLAYKRRAEWDAGFKLTSVALVMVILQGILGALTVTEKLHPLVVMGHLLGGFITFSILVALGTRLIGVGVNPLKIETLSFKALTNLMIVIVAIQIALGGWTSANYSALACTDLPICFSGWWQQADFIEGFQLWGHGAETYQYGVISNEAKVAVHAAHRIGAMVVLVALSFFLFRLFKSVGQTEKRYAWVLLILLVIQIVLGISNVVFGLPLAVAVAHNGVGALLLVSLVSFRTQIWMRRHAHLS